MVLRLDLAHLLLAQVEELQPLILIEVPAAILPTVLCSVPFAGSDNLDATSPGLLT